MQACQLARGLSAFCWMLKKKLHKRPVASSAYTMGRCPLALWMILSLFTLSHKQLAGAKCLHLSVVLIQYCQDKNNNDKNIKSFQPAWLIRGATRHQGRCPASYSRLHVRT